MKNKGMLSIVIVVATMLFAACGDADDDTVEEDRIVPVEVTSVSKGDLVLEKELYGRISPNKATPIIIDQPGEIDELDVENGDQVKEDDLIAKIKTPAGLQNIRAKADGEIAELNQAEGDMLSGEDPLAIILDLERVKIDFTVTEKDRSLFKKDDELKMDVNNEEYELTIKTVHTSPDETGLYPIEATAKNKEDELIPGMIAKIYVPEKRVKKSLIVDTAAIIEEAEDTFVYVVKDNEAIKTDVKILQSQSDRTAIEGEIKKDDEVVIDGQITLSDGQKVEVVEEENES